MAYDDMDASIAVVIPAFRVASTIKGVVEAVPDYVRHIIVVDDASPDESGVVLVVAGDVDAVFVAGRWPPVGTVRRMPGQITLVRCRLLVVSSEGSDTPRRWAMMVRPSPAATVYTAASALGEIGRAHV